MRLLLLSLFFLTAFAQPPDTAYMLIIGVEFPNTPAGSELAHHRDFPASVITSQSDQFGTRRVFNMAFRDRFFGYEPSVRDYFTKNSLGKVTLASAGVYGPYAAPESADHYWAKRSETCPHGWNDVHGERRALAIERFIEEEINIRKSFSLAAFDRDKNGRIDKHELIVVVIVPQKDTWGDARGAQRHEGDNSPWKVGSLEWDLYGDGDAVIELFSADMLKTGDLGLVAHETAHLLINAGDEYENAETLPNANPPGWDPTAPGPFSLMDQDDKHAYLDPLHRVRAGWLTPISISKDGYRTIEALASGGPVYRLGDQSRLVEYFLVENRQRVGYDTNLPDDGLAIWHIDESRLPDYRSMVEIEPACGPKNPVDYRQYLWEGATRDFGRASVSGVSSQWHDGENSGIGVWAISGSRAKMRAYFDVPGPGILVQVLPVKSAVPRGSKADFVVRLVNTGPTKDTFDLSIEGPGPGEFTQSQKTFILDPYQSADASVSVLIANCADGASITATGVSLTDKKVHTSDAGFVEGLDPDPAQAPDPDAYESNDTPATAKPLDLQEAIPVKIENLSLHTPSDTDYFGLKFQSETPGQCSSAVKKFPTGSIAAAWNVQYTPSSLKIKVRDEYCRPLRLTVSGSDGVWKSTTSEDGFDLECPEELFKDGGVIVAVSNPSGRVGRYSLEAVYSWGGMSLEKPKPTVGKPNKPMPPSFGVFNGQRIHNVDELVQRVDQGYPAYSELRGRMEWAEIQHALGQAALDAGKFSAARTYLDRSIGAFRELEMPAAEGDVARTLALLCSATKDDRGAITQFEEASRLHTKAGNEEGVAFDLIALARHHAARGDADQAFRAFDRAWEHQADADGRALNLMNQAEALLDLNSPEGAVVCARLAEEAGAQDASPETRDNLRARSEQLQRKLGPQFSDIGDSLGDLHSERRDAIRRVTGH